MSYKRLTITALILTLLLFSSLIGLRAQEEITAEKKILIQELLEITEAKKMCENIMNVMLLECENNYIKIMSQMLNEAKIPEDKKEKIQNEFIESKLRFSRRFRELFPQRLNLDQFVEELYYPLYNKYFTEDELKDLIIFYKSPTGRKTINITPQLMQESMSESNELLTPKIMQLINEILQEEKMRLLESGEGSQLKDK